jgi:hypothetical protein
MCIFPAPSGSKENTPTTPTTSAVEAENGSDKPRTHSITQPLSAGEDPGVTPNEADPGASDPGSPLPRPSTDAAKTKYTAYNSPDPVPGSKSPYAPSDLSVLRMRGHGYYSNITCLASEPCPLESG